MTTTPAPPTGSSRRLIGWAFVGIALVVMEIVVLALVLTTLALSVLWVTLPLFVGLVLATRALADGRRSFVSRRLGYAIARQYRPLPATGWWARFSTVIRDPANWRDARWMLVDMTAGLALLALPVGAFSAGVAGLSLGLWWWSLPTGASLDIAFGTTVHDTPSALIVGGGWGLFYLGLFWLITPACARTYGRLTAALLRPDDRRQLHERVEFLSTTRAQAVGSQANELRRIERDLHDGAQAHLVALGMSLGLVESMIDADPAVKQLLAEAREHNLQAITELRSLIKGIRPPVLSDRGLVGAVQSLALRIPLQIDVDLDVPGRLPEPIEAAAYFTVSEALANTVKYSGAARAWVRGEWANGWLRITVVDDGSGGAMIVPGGGLAGVQERLGAFDGTLTLAERGAGGTELTIELPVGVDQPPR